MSIKKNEIMNKSFTKVCISFSIILSMNDLQTVPGYKDRVDFEKSYELVKVLGNSCQLLDKVISFYGNTTREAPYQVSNGSHIEMASNVQYSGRSTFLLPTTANDTYYRKFALIFANKKITVEEEYLIMDFTGLIGAVGRTLGLFIGFSFKEITSLLIDGLKWILKKTRVSSATSDTRVLMIKE